VQVLLKLRAMSKEDSIVGGRKLERKEKKTSSIFLSIPTQQTIREDISAF